MVPKSKFSLAFQFQSLTQSNSCPSSPSNSYLPHQYLYPKSKSNIHLSLSLSLSFSKCLGLVDSCVRPEFLCLFVLATCKQDSSKRTQFVSEGNPNFQSLMLMFFSLSFIPKGNYCQSQLYQDLDPTSKATTINTYPFFLSSLSVLAFYSFYLHQP